MILGASILQLPAIKKAIDMGLEVIAVDLNPSAVGFNVPGVIKEVISTIDIPAVLEAAKLHQINGIITLASDMPMRCVAAVAKEYNLVGIDEETALRATNKVEMRNALAKNKVPIPLFFKVSSRDDYEIVVKKIRSPFIVKPADNSGSRGIFKIDDSTDEQTIFDAYEYSLKSSRNGDVIIEEYMHGPEVSVETLSLDGVCNVIQITDKLTSGAPHFVEMGHSQPTKLNPEIVEQICEVAKAANKAIGIYNGPSHTEIIVTNEGPKIVELGARLGGDCITTDLVPLSTGVDMVECCIKIALGEKPDITPKWQKGSAIRYFHQHAGIIESISGLDQAITVPGIQQISIVHGIGEKVTDVIDSASRMGFVIAQGENVDMAVESCNTALDLVHVRYKNA